MVKKGSSINMTSSKKVQNSWQMSYSTNNASERNITPALSPAALGVAKPSRSMASVQRSNCHCQNIYTVLYRNCYDALSFEDHSCWSWLV